MKKRVFHWIALCSIVLLNVGLYAQPPAGSSATTDTIPKPEKFITHHSSKIDGKLINYTATAGTILLKN